MKLQLDLAMRPAKQLIEHGVQPGVAVANGQYKLGPRKFVEQEIVFPLRQRVIDLQTQLAVNQQGGNHVHHGDIVRLALERLRDERGLAVRGGDAGHEAGPTRRDDR